MDEKKRRDFFRDQVLLAPLTRGGNQPYRRLLIELGATMTVSPMAVAQKIVRGDAEELRLLDKAPEERAFGAQLAGRHPEQLGEACRIAVDRGAAFVDLNLGCPIHTFTKSGMGAALLRRVGRVEKLVRAMRTAVRVPVSVKIRLGWSDEKLNYLTVGRAAQEAGADALVIHGRSRKQRYRRAADWRAIAELSDTLEIPVIGNGDILTWRDAQARKAASGCAGLMVGRGALIKPWIFGEIGEHRDKLSSPQRRYAVLVRYRDLAIAYFGASGGSYAKVKALLVWYLDFFNRYRPVPSIASTDLQEPLIQTRLEHDDLASSGDPLYARTQERRESLVDDLIDDWREQGPMSESQWIAAAGDLRVRTPGEQGNLSS